MADNRKQRHGQDRSRINLSEDYEVRYWTKELGVDEETLRTAVEQFGNNVQKVREALSTRK
jgi:hypothetical protein